MVTCVRRIKQRVGWFLTWVKLLPLLNRVWVCCCVPLSERIGSAQTPPVSALPPNPPICPHSETTLIRLWPRRIVRCRVCRVAFQPAGAVREEYVERYYRNPRTSYFTTDGEPNMHHPQIHSAFMRHCGLKIEGEGRCRLLEIGFANGTILKYFHDLGWDVCGVEVSHWAVEYVHNRWGFRVYEGDVRDIDLAAHTFDLVVLTMTVEHLQTPVAVLRRCVEILCPGGMLFVTVPDSEADPKDYENIGHRWYFTPYAFQCLLSSLGLQDVQVYREQHDMKIANLPILFGAGRKRE